MKIQLRYATLPSPLGLFAAHYWFVMWDADGCHRWEVWQTKNAGGRSIGHVHCDLRPPDAGVGGGPARIAAEWIGAEAAAIKVSLPLLEANVAMNPGDENLHLASTARRRHGRWCHMSSLRAPSDTLASRSTTRWRSRSKLRCNLAGLVTTAEPDGRRPANSCHSCPKKLTSAMTGVRAITDVARRRNRGEEIYKAVAQRLVTPAT